MYIEAIKDGYDTIAKIKQQTKANTGSKCKELNPSGLCCCKDIKKIIKKEELKLLLLLFFVGNPNTHLHVFAIHQLGIHSLF